MSAPSSLRDVAMKPLLGVVGTVFAFSAAVAVLLLASPVYMLQVYDRVLTTRHVETLLSLTLLLVAALAVLAGLDALRGLVLGRVGAVFEERATPAVLDRAVTLAARTGAGRSAQALRDVGAVRSFLAGNLTTAFDLPFVPLFQATLFLIHPAIGILVLAGSLVAFAVAVVNDRTTRRRAERANRVSAALLEEADAVVRNADVVVGMGLLGPLAERRRRLGAETDRDLDATADLGAMFTAASRFLRYFLQSAVLGLAAFLAISDQMSPGTLIAATTIASRAIGPIEQAVGMWRGVQAASFSWRRLAALFAEVPATAEPIRLPRPTGRVSVDRLVFTPAGRPAIIEGISFDLAPGEVFGLFGPSGGGKSTLVRLLVGSLPPTGGSVRLDGAEVSAMHPADRLAHVGYLPQDVELLPGSVRDNIARFTRADDAAVIAAARAVGAHEMILSLPQGYETPIGAGGTTLSGGQRQRIGLARAVFGDPALLVLDEPNASLDSVGEAELGTALVALKAKGTTIVVVTHRLAALAVADRVMLLRGGVAEVIGPRDEVLARMRPQPTPPRRPTEAGAPGVVRLHDQQARAATVGALREAAE